MRRLAVLSRRADRIIENRREVQKSITKSKNFLLQSLYSNGGEHLIKRALRENSDIPLRWVKFLNLYLNTISDEFLILQTEYAALNKTFDEVRRSGQELCDIFSKKYDSSPVRQQENDQIVNSQGMRFFELAGRLASASEVGLYQNLVNTMKSLEITSCVPEAHLSRYRKIESLSFLVAHVGMYLVAHESNRNERYPQNWCGICYRRALYGSKYCSVHRTSNDCQNKFRLGSRMRKAQNVDRDHLFMEIWEEHRRVITEIEGEEREVAQTFDSPHRKWKKFLTKRISKSAVLSRRLSVEVIQTLETWTDTVNYLRVQLENDYEPSLHLYAVWSWLQMAEDWFTIEDLFQPEVGSIRKISRSAVSKLPTVVQIITLCRQEPGIIKSEVARRLKLSRAAVGQLIKRHEELHEFFPRRH